MFAGTPAETVTSLSTAVLKPCRVTVTVYFPALSAGIVNEPFEAVTTVLVELNASLLTVTVAPGIAPPLESVTTPVIDEVAPPCANAVAATRDSSIAATDTHFALPWFMDRSSARNRTVVSWLNVGDTVPDVKAD